MIAKIIFIVLVGCAVTFAAPVEPNEDLNFEKIVDDQQAKQLSSIQEFIKGAIGAIFKPIVEGVLGSAKIVTVEIRKRLDTEVYREAIKQLKEILPKVLDDAEQEKLSEEKQKIIEEALDQLGSAYLDLVIQAVKDIQANNEAKVDAQGFQQAVEKFKKVVDEVYAE